MALPANVKSAKGVAQIDALYLYKHPGSGEPAITKGTSPNFTIDDSLAWKAFATIRGSVEFAQGEATFNKKYIDQTNIPIAVLEGDPSEFKISAKLPSLLQADLGEFLTKSAAKVTHGNKEGYGYDFSAPFNASALIITKTADVFVIPNGRFQVTLGKDDELFVLNLTGEVLTPSNPANQPLYILADNKSV